MKKVKLAHTLVDLCNKDELGTCFLRVRGKKQEYMKVYWLKRDGSLPIGAIE